MIQILRTTIGWLAIMLGGIALPFESLAILDPVGTKLSDDNDPFGAPPGWKFHAIYLTVITGLFFIGFLLLKRKKTKTK